MSERKKVLVTGGTQGIGLATVEKLLQEGYEVHITYRSSAKKADELMAAHPGQLFAHKLDQGDPQAVIAATFLKEVDWYGVVFNAALGSATVKQYAEQDTDPLGYKNDIAMLTVNALGPLWVYRMVMENIEKRNEQAKLVFLSSVGGGIFAFPRFTLSDGMSKCAISFLAKQIAAENAQTPIDVFSICPGATDTGMFQASTLNSMTPEEREAFLKTCAKNRLTDPSEIAYWIALLLRPESTPLHGSNIDASMGLGVRPGLMTEANLSKH